MKSSRQEISLNGSWKLNHFNYKEGNTKEIIQPNFIPEGWLDAQVPGEVHLDLKRLGKIQWFYYGHNPDEYKWIENSDWWYWTELFVEKSFKQDKVELVFEGLDCFSTIWLNGKEISQSSNMFVPVICDVTNKLNYSQRNTLIVRLASPIKSVEGKDTSQLFSTTSLDRILARKAQMSYSWDFCGRCVTTGIWKPVYLQSYKSCAIRDIHLVTKILENNNARLDFEIDIENFKNSKVNSSLEIELSKGNRKKRIKIKPNLVKRNNVIKHQHRLKNAEFWWPWNLGKPNLYDLSVSIKQGNTILDTSHQKLGIREVKLIQQPQDDGGHSFIFSINNRQFFTKGANWVAPNMTFADISKEDYRYRLQLAKESNIHMLRIWGGGIYEHDDFYNLCDEMGILIWHDFMFACGVYPQDKEFQDLVRKESEYQVRRLRNHPCLIVWSGDNENDAAYQWAQRPFGAWNENVLTRKVLKEVTETLDPSRPYLPSSPYSLDPTKEPQDQKQGDGHHYNFIVNPNNQNYYKKYSELESRFESEFGFAVLPEPDSYFKFNHLRLPLKSLEERMTDAFPLAHKLSLTNPVELNSFLWESQLFHAYGLRYVVEHFRRNKWHCGGTLYWKFNDPYADAQWVFPSQMSTIDLYCKPRIAYYWTKNAYNPVILSFKEDSDNQISLWGVNDMDSHISGTLLLQLLTFNGEIIHQEKIPVYIPPDHSVKLKTIAFDKKMDKQKEFFYAQLKNDKVNLETTYFPWDFLGWRGLAFPEAKLNIKTNQSKNGLEVKIKTDNYANVIRLDIPDVAMKYSDNFFSLIPKSSKVLLLEPRKKKADLRGKRLIINALNSKTYQIDL